MSITVIKSREARAQWRTLLDAVLTGQADVVIERNGKAVAAMIPIEDYTQLLDELDDLRAARRAAEAYAEYRAHPAGGKSWSELRADLVSEGRLDE
jgi:prevent-host-death family protein